MWKHCHDIYISPHLALPMIDTRGSSCQYNSGGIAQGHGENLEFYTNSNNHNSTHTINTRQMGTPNLLILLWVFCTQANLR